MPSNGHARKELVIVGDFKDNRPIVKVTLAGHELKELSTREARQFARILHRAARSVDHELALVIALEDAGVPIKQAADVLKHYRDVCEDIGI